MSAQGEKKLIGLIPSKFLFYIIEHRITSGYIASKTKLQVEYGTYITLVRIRSGDNREVATIFPKPEINSVSKSEAW